MADFLPSLVKWAWLKLETQPTSKGACPTLPVELWIPILEDAVRDGLSFILDQDIEPFQIDAYHAAFVGGQGTAHHAKALARKRKRQLRAVCRQWKYIVDSMQNDTLVIDVCNLGRSMDALLQPKTKKYERINVLYYSSMQPQVKLRYIHPVSTLSLHVSSDTSRNESGSMSSLGDVILFPEKLRALHLCFSDCAAPYNLFKYLQESTPNLTALSLNLSSKHLLNTTLTLPKVVTLFLTAPNSSGYIPSTKWNLPSLRNLSTEWHPYTLGSNTNVEYRDYQSILTQHRQQIVSLRIDPLRALHVEPSSPYAWTRLPRLQAIATDFELFSPGSAGRPWAASSSIRHIIQINNSRPHKFWNGLKDALNLCPKVESVSISPKTNLFGDVWKLPKEDESALAELKRLCEKRNIMINDREGNLLKL